MSSCEWTIGKWASTRPIGQRSGNLTVTGTDALLYILAAVVIQPQFFKIPALSLSLCEIRNRFFNRQSPGESAREKSSPQASPLTRINASR